MAAALLSSATPAGVRLLLPVVPLPWPALIVAGFPGSGFVACYLISLSDTIIIPFLYNVNTFLNILFKKIKNIFDN
jgi:hypothetical protein